MVYTLSMVCTHNVKQNEMGPHPETMCTPTGCTHYAMCEHYMKPKETLCGNVQHLPLKIYSFKS